MVEITIQQVQLVGLGMELFMDLKEFHRKITKLFKIMES
jgi:hypothetical protein